MWTLITDSRSRVLPETSYPLQQPQTFRPRESDALHFDGEAMPTALLRMRAQRI